MNHQRISRRQLMAAAVGGALLATVRAGGQSADPTTLTIADASRRIRSRTLSPVELTKAYLARIEQHNPRLNAYITVTGDAALAQAHALEAELARGRSRGPLHGIPVALKDNIDTAGVRTTAASALFADRLPAEDAFVVTRLRDAGAVFLGKLNMHEFAYGGTSAVSHFGPVRNPWQTAYIPGGSSGGSAAAVAARMCASALGTDTAASIRMPAAFCGVVGFKATHGLASIRGIIPLAESHDHVGPLCRSVEDSALMLTALAGFDPRDPVSIAAGRVDYGGAVAGAVRPLRVGIPRKPFFDELDPEIAAAVESAIGLIGKMTRSVAEVTLPAIDTFAVMLAEIYAYHATYAADADHSRQYQPLTLQRILDGAKIPLPLYIDGRRQMMVARHTVGRVFDNVDVLVTPTTMTLPGTIADAVENAPSELRLIRNTVPFNAYGIPTVSLPCGFARGGLPIGLQISGPRLGEARVLALAHAYERATEWHRREPPSP